MSRIYLIAATLLVLGAPFAYAEPQTSPPLSTGEYLARAGDCIACHSVAGGQGLRRRSQDGNADGRPLHDEHHAR